MKTYKVKGLDWREGKNRVPWVADTIVGRIAVLSGQIAVGIHSAAAELKPMRTAGFWFMCGEYYDASGYPSFNAAKAAAESWYLSRLLPALEEVTA